MSWDANRERSLSIVVDYILDGLARVHWKKGRLADADMEVRRALRELLPTPSANSTQSSQELAELQKRIEEVEKKTAHKPTLFDLSTRLHDQQQQLVGWRQKLQALDALQACVEGQALCIADLQTWKKHAAAKLSELQQQIDKLTAGQVSEAARDVLAEEAKAQAGAEAVEPALQPLVAAFDRMADRKAEQLAEELTRERRRHQVTSARANLLHDELRGALRFAVNIEAMLRSRDSLQGEPLTTLHDLQRWRAGVFDRTGLKP